LEEKEDALKGKRRAKRRSVVDILSRALSDVKKIPLHFVVFFEIFRRCVARRLRKRGASRKKKRRLPTQKRSETALKIVVKRQNLNG